MANLTAARDAYVEPRLIESHSIAEPARVAATTTTTSSLVSDETLKREITTIEKPLASLEKLRRS
jgi:hypothetical protein